MARRDLLGVLLKTLGVWTLVGGIAGLPQAVRFTHDYPDEQAFLQMMADTFIGPSFLIVAGWFLIRATDWFVRIADPGNSPSADNAVDSKAREMFGVTLKALGFLEIINGVVRLPYDLASFSRAGTYPYDGIAYAGITIVAGCFLIFATDWCVRLAYRTPVGDV